ncbi:MAG: hypothetical protein IPJ13_32305 [Saprospiraceae bacterium]|nr:hypothetical protein [Saprospiraceae bacterium]
MKTIRAILYKAIQEDYFPQEKTHSSSTS